MEKHLPIVRKAIQDFNDGTYIFPTHYYIVDDIPPIPGQIQVVHPSKVRDDCGWVDLRVAKGVGNQNSGGNRFPRTTPIIPQTPRHSARTGITPHFVWNSDDQDMSPLSSPSTTRSSGFVPNTQPSGFGPTFARPSTSSSSLHSNFFQVRPTFTNTGNNAIFQGASDRRFLLTTHMKVYLRMHCGLSEIEIAQVDDIISRVKARTPTMVAEVVPFLVTDNLNEDSARFLCNWIFDICETDNI
jgi:hypothetical protein